MRQEMKNKRLVIVSNRLPVAIDKDDSGKWVIQPGTGGLVTALEPVVRESGGMWIGWPGVSSAAPIHRLLEESGEASSIKYIPVEITENEIDKYYRGFSNRCLWPLFHDLLGQFSFAPEEYEVYKEVNRRFAENIAEHVRPDDFIWIHDYQLLFVAHYLRELGITNNLNFFLHIPFPGYDLIRRFPRKRTLFEAMLKYDHIGFQTPNDRRNFIGSIKWILPDARRFVRKRQALVEYKNQKSLMGFYPISIDYNFFNNLADTRETQDAAWYLKENINGQTMALGLDRLDYTKGIPQRFLAFEKLLEKYPDTHGQITLMQVVVPSRLNVPEYQGLKEELDLLAGRINGRFSREGWVPIHYQFRTLNKVQLVGHYRAAEIALLTPLRDGMNLVAKEYCASSRDEEGTLILSEFAGAAAQLAKGALTVNPYDIDRTADAIYRAFTMPKEEQKRRMRLLRAEIRRNDVHRWVRWFFGREEESAQYHD